MSVCTSFRCALEEKSGIASKSFFQMPNPPIPRGKNTVNEFVNGVAYTSIMFPVGLLCDGKKNNRAFVRCADDLRYSARRGKTNCHCAASCLGSTRLGGETYSKFLSAPILTLERK